MGVRYNVGRPAWLTALPTVTSINGRLVMASMCAIGFAALQ